MKKPTLIFPVIIILVIATAWQFPDQSSSISNPIGQDLKTIDCPDNVMRILQQSCYDCHTDASGNVMAKGKLNFSKWEGYEAAKKVSKLEKICEEVTENKMPKKKYLKKHPESALSDKDITAICEWTEAETKKLFGE